MKKIIIGALLAGTLAACSTATMHAPSAPPLRDAELYPVNQSTAGLSIAVDEITDAERGRRYFGSDLTREGILPVNVVMTNHGDDTFLIKPSDVLLTDGTRVIDAVPGEKVIKDGAGTVLQETVIPPGGSAQGVLFFPVRKGETGLYGKVQKMLSDKMQLRLLALDKTTGERLLFGPFSIGGF